METTVVYQQHDPSTAVITLNRPAKRNALTIELMEKLCEIIGRLESVPDCRVLIIRGAGPVFCAGLDLHEAAELEVAEQSAKWVAKTFSSIAASPLVTIAAVHGAAMAGGAGLMSSCDLVVAADDLQIGFPEVRRGLVPALVSKVLRHRLRDSEMRELFLLGDPIDVQRALRLGLVHRVVSAHELLDTALGMAQTICKGGPEAVRQTKKLVSQICSSSESESTEVAMEFHRQARASEEAGEGLAAFGQRREPKW